MDNLNRIYMGGMFTIFVFGISLILSHTETELNFKTFVCEKTIFNLRNSNNILLEFIINKDLEH